MRIKLNNKNNNFSVIPVCSLLASLIAVFGYFFNKIVVGYGTITEQQSLLSRAITAASSFNPAPVASLKGLPEDVNMHNFKDIRSQLVRIRSANKDARFVYLMALKNDNVIFIADAESPTSEDYSAPGDIYEDASSELFSIFLKSEPFVEGPLEDKWGVWVTGHAPILDSKTNKVLAVIGMDIDAGLWQKNINVYRWFTFSITGLIFLIVFISFSALYRKSTANKNLVSEIDERLEAEKKLSRLNEQLHKQHQDLENAHSELKTAQSQMLHGEKMASIGQLAAGVAHEINNPVGFISSNLGTLSKYVDRFTEYSNALKNGVRDESEKELKELNKKLKIDFITEDSKELIKESLDGTDRVGKIVQNLKSFSRLDEAEHKPSDINECLDSTLNIAWNEIKYKATVIKDYGDLPLIRCYPQQLNQVFLNLLVNAAHAIEKQGEINIKTWQQNNSVFISVADNGSGIPEEIMNRLFEPFFTTKDVGKGTGLGLSIAYDIIKKHQGELSVQSEVGNGSTFTVKLPLIED